MAVREWLRMQVPDLFRAYIFKPVPNCKKMRQYIKKYLCFSGINEVLLTLLMNACFIFMAQINLLTAHPS